MVSRLRRPRHSDAGAERAAQAGHSAGEVLLRLGHRLLVAVSLLSEHLRISRHPRPRAGGRHGREVRPPRPFRVGHHRRRRQSLHRHQPFHPLPAAEPRSQHPAVEQPDLRSDQGPVFAHVRVRQEDQVQPLGNDRAADPSDRDRLGGGSHLRGPLGGRQPAAPGADAGSGGAAQGRVVCRDPARLRGLQRGRAQQPGRAPRVATTIGSSSSTASRCGSARMGKRGSCFAARRPKWSRSAAACGSRT